MEDNRNLDELIVSLTDANIDLVELIETKLVKNEKKIKNLQFWLFVLFGLNLYEILKRNQVKVTINRK